VNRVANELPGRQVATVGRVQALPGAPNVIPGKVAMSLEIRDLDAAKMQQVFDRIEAEAARIAAARSTPISFQELAVGATPAPTDPRMRDIIDASAKSLGLKTQRMPSGAGHDAQHVAQIAPAGMIFVPSVGGISHSPKESTSPQDMANGVNVLLQATLAVDREFR
jgi:N-carbamoyl-L-amino-acid hydrolase